MNLFTISTAGITIFIIYKFIKEKTKIIQYIDDKLFELTCRMYNEDEEIQEVVEMTEPEIKEILKDEYNDSEDNDYINIYN